MVLCCCRHLVCHLHHNLKWRLLRFLNCLSLPPGFDTFCLANKGMYRCDIQQQLRNVASHTVVVVFPEVQATPVRTDRMALVVAGHTFNGTSKITVHWCSLIHCKQTWKEFLDSGKACEDHVASLGGPRTPVEQVNPFSFRASTNNYVTK